MTCGISNAEIHFPKTGVVLAPYEVDLRQERGKFDHARVRVSREAGELLADSTSGDPNHPALIHAGGRVLRRMYLPGDAIELGQEEAWFKLMDPLHVTTQGICDRNFKEVTLEDALDYVMDNVVDNNGVIVDHDIADPQYSDQMQPNYEAWQQHSLFAVANDWIEGDSGGVVQNTLEDYTEQGAEMSMWVNRQLNNLTGIWGDIGTLEFNQSSPWESLQMICDEWELEVWVDDGATLWVGKREAQPKTHISTPNEDTITISKYNVTEAALPVAEVIVKGGKTRLSYDSTRDGNNDSTGPVGNKGVKTWGQARVDGVENGRTITIDNKDLHTGEALQNAAEQRLINEMAKNKSGNVEINPSVSGFTEFSQPQTIKAGDFLDVRHPPTHKCSNFSSDGGQFIITSANHMIKGGDGWKITAEVADIPDKEIQSRFFYYKPEEDEIVEPGDLYSQAQNVSLDI